MRDAILKTLAYFDCFDYPLKAWEIHKWLTQKKGSLRQTEKVLKKLLEEKKIFEYKQFYFLKKRAGIVNKRFKKEKISESRMRRAKIIAFLLKIIPWIKLIGVSGSLSMLSSQKTDDIDFFVITEKNRIWLSRLLLVFIINLTGLRRKRREKILSASGKICINLILESDNLALDKRNIYLAHEMLQMKVLWQRDEIYSKFLHDNNWVFRFLPNWKSGIKQIQKSKPHALFSGAKSQNHNSKFKNAKIIDWLEKTAKTLQLRIMNSPSGAERIENGALYFHPEDKGIKVLKEYNKKLKKLSIV